MATSWRGLVPEGERSDSPAPVLGALLRGTAPGAPDALVSALDRGHFAPGKRSESTESTMQGLGFEDLLAELRSQSRERRAEHDNLMGAFLKSEQVFVDAIHKETRELIERLQLSGLHLENHARGAILPELGSRTIAMTEVRESEVSQDAAKLLIPSQKTAQIKETISQVVNPQRVSENYLMTVSDKISLVIPDDNFFSEPVKRSVNWYLSLHEPHRHGCLANLVRHQRFEYSCLFVIILNAIFAVYLADWEMKNLNDEPTTFITLTEFGLLIFYMTELLLKLSVHRLYFFINEEWRWNLFDLVLVLLSLWDQVTTYYMLGESGGSSVTFMRMFKLLKLGKVMRLFRVMKFFSELRLMLLAMNRSIISLFWCLVLLCFVLYVFALFIIQGMANYLSSHLTEHGTFPDNFEDIERRFGTMRLASMTLYKAATGGADWGDDFNVVAEAGMLYSSLYVFYIAFFNFAVMNILTGMIVENVVKMSDQDEQAMLFVYRQRQESNYHAICKLFEEFDADGDGHISPKEFTEGMNSERLQALLNSIDLEITDAAWFFKQLLAMSEDQIVDIATFAEGCMKMKGPATSLDLQCLAFEIKMNRGKLHRLERTVAAFTREDRFSRCSI